MNLETKIIIYKFTPQVFTLTPNHYTLLYIIIHRIFIRLIPELRC
jgi:hypothetical protein